MEFVVLPDAVAAVLWRQLDLARLSREWRGRNAVLDDTMTRWARVATNYKPGAVSGTVVAPQREPAGCSRPEGMTVAQLAAERGVTPRAVRRAVERGQLVGEMVAGRYWFAMEAIDAWPQRQSPK